MIQGTPGHPCHYLGTFGSVKLVPSPPPPWFPLPKPYPPNGVHLNDLTYGFSPSLFLLSALFSRPCLLYKSPCKSHPFYVTSPVLCAESFHCRPNSEHLQQVSRISKLYCLRVALTTLASWKHLKFLSFPGGIPNFVRDLICMRSYLARAWMNRSRSGTAETRN